MTAVPGHVSDLGGRVIMGLDPGTASTGYGVVEVKGNRLRALDFGVIETPAGLPLESRLEAIFGRVRELLARYQPSATAVESLFFNANVRTAFAVGQARGVTLLACSLAGCQVFEYTPQQIKQAVVGYGRASKDQVMEMVRVLLALAEPPRPDHAADALGVAICHANSCGVRERLERCRAEQARGRGRA
jgi:crossover junction endodeoxyribonuclease RuvC